MNINDNQITSASQTKLIAQWLKEGKTLTQMDALNMFGCFRLASRISDIKTKYGWQIATDKITTPTGKRVASYRLISEI